jgi:transcriptional regulator with XRE-family HTH domain
MGFLLDLTTSVLLTIYCKEDTVSGGGLQAVRTPDKKAQNAMRFGERLRELRRAKNLSQRDLAGEVGVNFTYISKIENEKLDFAQFPGEELIRKLAAALEADEDELLLLANKVPEHIRQRVIARPDAFRRLAALDDKTLDGLLAQVHGATEPLPTRRRPR